MAASFSLTSTVFLYATMFWLMICGSSLVPVKNSGGPAGRMSAVVQRGGKKKVMFVKLWVLGVLTKKPKE